MEMEDLLHMVQSNEDAAEAQELDGGELVINGARLQTSSQLARDKQDATPQISFNFNYAEQAAFNDIIAQYRRCGMLIAEPEDKEPIEQAPAPTEAEIQMASLKQAADEARREYARRSAIRGARVMRFGQYSEEAVAEARKQYEDRKQELLKQERNTALAAGVNADTFDRYAPAAAIPEAWKLAQEISEARKLASRKWQAEDIHIHTTGKHYKAVPVLDEAAPLTRVKRVFFGKLWGERDQDKKIVSAQNALLVLRRAAAIGAAPAALAGGILLPPLGAAYMVAGSGGLAGWMAKKVSEYKPGYKPGRTAKWVLDREAEHEEVLFSAASSVRPRGTKVERKKYNDAELDKAFGYAMVHAKPANRTINRLGKTIADMIDEETSKRLPNNQSKLAFQVGTAALASSAVIIL